MKPSFNSPGLQLVDICLYLISHKDIILTHHEESPGTAFVLMYIISHGSAFDFTLNGFIRESNEFHEKIMSIPFTKEELKKGQNIINELEGKWKENYLKVGKKE
jgi:hypothetical protein